MAVMCRATKIPSHNVQWSGHMKAPMGAAVSRVLTKMPKLVEKKGLINAISIAALLEFDGHCIITAMEATKKAVQYGRVISHGVKAELASRAQAFIIYLPCENKRMLDQGNHSQRLKIMPDPSEQTVTSLCIPALTLISFDTTVVSSCPVYSSVQVENRCCRASLKQQTEAQRETALVKDILGEAGLPCDELNPSGPRSYPEDHRAQKIVGGVIELVEQLAKEGENEEIKAICVGSLLKSRAEQRSPTSSNSKH
ncbi:hypothetical protein QTO34_005279 [Cnephaeus nilssonii]|uniref:Uncharacterized protein n=1 Tax=Cnephaeus nilssonii TaxID=3371016 RepID=A0AA40LHY7_CNENI|nr:hypothetical protein QTO34_005279 [Eptesicus nilssonii]